MCRILNRFTKDMHFMDDLLPLTVYDFIICAFMVFGGVLIVFIVNPWVVLRCGIMMMAESHGYGGSLGDNYDFDGFI